jgi:hypothetical protein
MQIRSIGSYEIVLYDSKNSRILEEISDLSMIGSSNKAEQLLDAVPEATSYTVSRILYNSKYNVWAPKQ